MFRVYQSNKLENLAESLAREYRPPASPLQPETVIVQSQGMGRWVSLRLAEKLGICANQQFVLPAAFTWGLLREYFGDLPKRSPFSAEILTFRVMAWLGKPDNLARAPRLGDYLRSGGELRRFELAVRIAYVFDQYLVYREDWLASWEGGETLGLGGDERWQALLWRDLVLEDTAPHRGRLMGELLARIERWSCSSHLTTEGASRSEGATLSTRGEHRVFPCFGTRQNAEEPAFAKISRRNPASGGAVAGDVSDLRERAQWEGRADRLTVFGISNLSPLFLDLLRALGQHWDVVVYAFNPCREYWGEIRDTREIGRLAGGALPEDLYLEVGHPLLASLGKQGPAFFDALSDCAETCPLFEEIPPRDSLLHILQADILELVDRKDAGRLPLSREDRSLQIHVCHSAMREVEVLRDQLLARFEADPQLTPADVAVLTPDIEKYAPYIDAVFAEGRDALRIPYSIADRGLAPQHPLLAAFLGFLDLPESRFTADTTLAYLEQPAIRRRFGLAEDDLPQIHDWVRATGARWGRDAAHKAEFGLPETPRHTWRDAVRRLLVGYALPQELAGDGLPLFGDTLPYDDVEGGRAQSLGGLADFLETLFEWADRLKGSRPAASWSERLNALADRMFEAEGEDEAVLLQLRSALDVLRELAEQAGFGEPIGVRTVKSWLAARLAEPSGSVGFLTGQVSFCAMVPMRSLPFKFIAVLGLDHDAFPRRRHPPGFDLMARHPRRGDRSCRLDDRYLFLETLLSARQSLYLSYVGRGIRDNAELPPSPLVNELIEVATQSVELAGGDLEKHLVVEHPLQPFDPAYFRGNPRLPGFSPTWLAAARRLGLGEKKPVPLFERELPEPEGEAWPVLELDDLLSFYGNPARYLLRKRLQVVLEGAEEPFETREPFGLDYFTEMGLREDCLAALLATQPADASARLAEARGDLPHGAFGLRLQAQEQALVENFLQAPLPYLRTDCFPPLAVEFGAGDFRLTGVLRRISPHGLIHAVPDKFRATHALALWLRHLMLCHLRPEGARLESRLFCLDRRVVLAPVERPEPQMEKLLRHFRRGLRWPLPFFVKSSHVFAEEMKLKEANEEAALRAAHKVWDVPEFRSGNHRGESENAYYQTVYRGTDPLDGEFEALALDVFGPYFDAQASGEST